MSVTSVPRSTMNAARAPIDDAAAASPASSSTATLLEGVLWSDPATCQRALTALVADELIVLATWPAISVIELPDGTWAVDLPRAGGTGLVVVPRVRGTDIDSVMWELIPRAASGGPDASAAPLAVEPLGLQPSLVHELLACARPAS